MIQESLALAATAVSAVATLPQLRHTWRSRSRHDISHLALAGSLFVAGSWFLWSLRNDEPLPAVASAIGFFSHLALTTRARRRPWLVLLALPFLAVSVLAPLTVVEGLTSAVAFATLAPHLFSALRAPHDVAPGRWLLEATEELLWAGWAVAIAAPLIAAPSLATVPVALAIAWRAWTGARRRPGVTAGDEPARPRPALSSFRASTVPTRRRQWGRVAAPPPLYHPV